MSIRRQGICQIHTRCILPEIRPCNRDLQNEAVVVAHASLIAKGFQLPAHWPSQNQRKHERHRSRKHALPSYQGSHRSCLPPPVKRVVQLPHME